MSSVSHRKAGRALPQRQMARTAKSVGVSAEASSAALTSTTIMTETTETTETTEVTATAETTETMEIIDVCGEADLGDSGDPKYPPKYPSKVAEVPGVPVVLSGPQVAAPIKTSETGTTSSHTTFTAVGGATTASLEELVSNFSITNGESHKAAQITSTQTQTTGLKHGHAGNKLVIGIDFGTTYTGIAYGLTSDPTKIKIVKEWPGKAIRGRNDIVKIPTIIKYGDAPKDNSKHFDFDWGHKVSEDAQGVIRGFKLGLHPEQRAFYRAAAGIPAADDMVHSHEETAKVERQRLDRSTVDIVGDYLGAVYKHALAKIYKAELPGIAALPKEFVITVPASWTDAAKSATLRAARAAHPDLALISPGDLVKEPEAAALHTLQDFQKRGLVEGDTFVLCDAGGGTVDLISYRLSSVQPRMRVKEVVEASGGAVGSMMINNGFERHLRKILGDEILAKMKAGDGASFHSVMRNFDQQIKPYFVSAEKWDEGEGEDDEGIEDAIDIPNMALKDDPEKNIRGGTLTITGTVLDEIFNPLVTAIEKLVREQIDGVKEKTGKPPKCILLVGGFGASPYLRRRLEEMVRAENIDVVRPEEAQAAVVKGAVLYKMPNTVEVIANIAPTSLGVSADERYDPLSHPDTALDHLVHDQREGVLRVPKMTWFIIKGDELDRTGTHPIRFPCYRDVPLHYAPANLVFEDELDESDAVMPPDFPWQGAGVRRKCVVRTDLSKMMGDVGALLERRTAVDGAEYYALEYELVVLIRSAFMTFAVECQGRRLGTASVEYK